MVIIMNSNKQLWDKYEVLATGEVQSEDKIPEPDYEQIVLAYVDNGRTHTIFGKIKVNIKWIERIQKPESKMMYDWITVHKNEDRIRTFVLECFPKKISMASLYNHIEQQIKSGKSTCSRYTIGYKRLVVYDIFAKNGSGWHYTFTEDKFSFTLRKDVIADNFNQDY